jgi:hypothetical protein
LPKSIGNTACKARNNYSTKNAVMTDGPSGSTNASAHELKKATYTLKCMETKFAITGSPKERYHSKKFTRSIGSTAKKQSNDYHHSPSRAVDLKIQFRTLCGREEDEKTKRMDSRQIPPMP